MTRNIEYTTLPVPASSPAPRAVPGAPVPREVLPTPTPPVEMSGEAEAFQMGKASVKAQLALRTQQAWAAARGLQQKVVKAAEPVTSRASTAKAFVISYASYIHVFAVDQCEVLRSQGIKVWTGQAMALGMQTWDNLKSTAEASCSKARQSILELVDASHKSVSSVSLAAKTRVLSTATIAKSKAGELQAGAKKIASDGKFQATAAGVAGGAATLGASGAVTGLAAGSALGAAVGFIPAIFTFGLSIPLGAAIGGSTGLVFGAASGAATGAVGGGAAGYGAYAKRGEIKEATQKSMAKISSGADFVKCKAKQSAGFVKGKVSEVRGRLSESTGGTA